MARLLNPPLDMYYLGSFRLPSGDGTSNQCANFTQKGSFQTQPGGACYVPVYGAANSPYGSFYLTGSNIDACKLNQMVAEVLIPDDSQILAINGGDPSALNTATLVQPFCFLTMNANGVSYEQSYVGNGNGMVIGGLQHDAVNHRVYWAIYAIYDGNNKKGFGYSSDVFNPNVGTAVGAGAPFVNPVFSDNAFESGSGLLIAGFIEPIHPDWVSRFLGDTHYGTLFGPSELSRTYVGTAMFGYKLADVGVINPFNGHEWLFYNSSAGPDSITEMYWVTSRSNPLYGVADGNAGVAGSFFFDDTQKRGVVFMGSEPSGATWYGYGSFADWAQSTESNSGLSGQTIPNFPGDNWGINDGSPGTWHNWPGMITACGGAQNVPPLRPGFRQPNNFFADENPNDCPGILIGNQQPGIDVPTDPYYFDPFNGADKADHTGNGAYPVFWIYDPQDILDNPPYTHNDGFFYSDLIPQKFYFDQVLDITGTFSNPYFPADHNRATGYHFHGMQATFYEPGRKRLYIVDEDVDGSPPFSSITPNPLIHVYQILPPGSVSSSPAASSPEASSPLASSPVESSIALSPQPSSPLASSPGVSSPPLSPQPSSPTVSSGLSGISPPPCSIVINAQSPKTQVSGDTHVTIMNFAMTQGDMVIVAAVCTTSGPTLGNIICTDGVNTYVQDLTTTSNGNQFLVFRATNVTAGTRNIVVASDSPANDKYFTAAAIDVGGLPNPVIDVLKTNVDNSGSNPNVTTGNTQRTAQPCELAVAGFLDNALAPFPETLVDPPAGYTRLFAEPDGSAYPTGAADFRIIRGTEVPQPGWTNGGSAWASGVVTYKSAIIPSVGSSAVPSSGSPSSPALSSLIVSPQAAPSSPSSAILSLSAAPSPSSALASSAVVSSAVSSPSSALPSSAQPSSVVTSSPGVSSPLVSSSLIVSSSGISLSLLPSLSSPSPPTSPHPSSVVASSIVSSAISSPAISSPSFAAGLSSLQPSSGVSSVSSLGASPALSSVIVASSPISSGVMSSLISSITPSSLVVPSSALPSSLVSLLPSGVSSPQAPSLASSLVSSLVSATSSRRLSSPSSPSSSRISSSSHVIVAKPSASPSFAPGAIILDTITFVDNVDDISTWLESN